MLKLLCSVLKVSIIYYQKFTSNAIKVGCEVNLHILHTANKITTSKQHELLQHIDSAKVFHIDLNVNDKFEEQAEKVANQDM